jgi:hypothetical protein
MATDSPYERKKVVTEEDLTLLPKKLQTKTSREKNALKQQTENDHLHAEKTMIKSQPLGPYNRDAASGDNPEVDDIADGNEAQTRDMMKHTEKAEGDR